MKTKLTRSLVTITLLTLGSTLLASNALARNKTRTGSGANGGSFSQQVHSANGVSQRDSTWTNPACQTGSNHATATTTGSGSATATGGYTRTNGNSGTYAGTVTTAGGKTASVQPSTSHANDSLTVNTGRDYCRRESVRRAGPENRRPKPTPSPPPARRMPP